jgi:hypothetical protein
MNKIVGILIHHEGHEEHEVEIMVYFLSLRIFHALHVENQTFYDFIKLYA